MESTMIERPPGTPDRIVRRRQDPVSCRLCRVKKLKCNRQRPCSNCVARNQDCEYEQNQTTAAARMQHDAEPSNAAILSRLQRLEDMIVRMGQNIPNTPETASPARSGPNGLGATSLLTPAEEAHSLGCHRLTNVGSTVSSLFPNMSGSFIFETAPLDLIAKHESCAHNSRPPSHRQGRFLMPTYKEARDLFDKYCKYVAFYLHIIHLPTLRKLLEEVYAKLSRREHVNTDHAALLLSVFASVPCYAQPSEQDSAVVEESSIRDNIFLVFFRSTLDLLDHSRRVLAPSLESIQTTILCVYLDYNLEGFTSRARAILNQGLFSAKELGMHRLDSPAEIRRREGPQTIDALIDMEMKRRIWWHMVAADWMLGLTGSPMEGTYTIHPQQMRVRLPRNIDDEVLDRGNTAEDLPLTQPSAMCYPLQRVRLSEISRTVVDTLRFGLSDVIEHDYNQVMMLDQRIQHFLDDLPIFFKLDHDSMQKSQYILEGYPYFAMQRYVINMGVHGVRCKLHQPFLVRGSEDPRYQPSAQICLSSAMTVLEINKAVRADPINFISDKVRLVGLLHHMFLATVVLVMDLCFNKVNGGEDTRSGDVMHAIAMLEEAKYQSAPCQRFLDSLMDALKRHQVRLDNDPKKVVLQSQPLNPLTNSALWQPALNNQEPTPLVQAAAPLDNGEGNGSGAAGYWSWQNAFDQSDFANMPNWDQLFSELDTFIA